MAEFKAISSEKFLNTPLATLNYITISGTVKKEGIGIIRTIVIFKGLNGSSFAETSSDSSGNWSATIVANPNDRIRVMCMADPNDEENSEVYDFINLA